MLKAINWYKREIHFGFIVIVCLICAAIIGLQIATFYLFQSENTMWQGICKGGNLIEGSNDSVIMKVHCPLQDEFLTDSLSVIMASKNEGQVFYCKKTEGNIMKDETWYCSVPIHSRQGEE